MCPSCKNPVELDWKFCGYCMTDLRDSIFTCPNCGFELQKHFLEDNPAVIGCPGCGTNIRELI